MRLRIEFRFLVGLRRNQPPIPAGNLRVLPKPVVVRRERSRLARQVLTLRTLTRSTAVEKVLAIERREQSRSSLRSQPVIERLQKCRRVVPEGPDDRLRRADSRLDDQVRVLSCLQGCEIFRGYCVADLPFRQPLDQAIARLVYLNDFDVVVQLIVQLEELSQIWRGSGHMNLLTGQLPRRSDQACVHPYGLWNRLLLLARHGGGNGGWRATLRRLGASALHHDRRGRVERVGH